MFFFVIQMLPKKDTAGKDTQSSHSLPEKKKSSIIKNKECDRRYSYHRKMKRIRAKRKNRKTDKIDRKSHSHLDGTHKKKEGKWIKKKWDVKKIKKKGDFKSSAKN